MNTHPDAPRSIQSNDVASIVIQQAAEHVPGLFVTLDFRYGIADALWAAGYRKVGRDAPSVGTRTCTCGDVFDATLYGQAQFTHHALFALPHGAALGPVRGVQS